MPGSGVVEVTATYATNPFRGPFPLREGDPIFGRDKAIKRLFDQLLSDRLVLLHSMSGCGKTSLVEAGLRPLLKDTFTPFPTINLKRSAEATASASALLAKMAASFAPHVTVPLKSPQVDPAVVSALIDSLADSRAVKDAPSAKLLFNFLFFDQFEEVLSDRQLSDNDREAFFRALGLMLENRNTWALFAIREDYLGALQPYLRVLPSRLSSRFRLTRLSIDEAASAIRMEQKEHGKTVRIAFKPDAAAHIADDLGAHGDSDPSSGVVEPVHLQVVCDFLWRNRSRHPIELDDVRELGEKLVSVTSALAEYYKNTLAELTKGDEDTEFRLRSWFENSLIENHERRNRVRVVPDSKEITLAQLNFLKERYLIRDDQPSAPAADRVIELAHDRLILPVIEQNKEWFRRYQQDWLESAADYAKKPAPSLLLTGQHLKDAEQWARKNQAKLQPFQKTFLNASRDQERRKSRMRWLTFWAVASSLTAVGFVLWAVHEKRQASESSQQAQEATQQSQSDVARGRAELAAFQSEQALLKKQSDIQMRQQQQELQILRGRQIALETSLNDKQKQLDDTQREADRIQKQSDYNNKIAQMALTEAFKQTGEESAKTQQFSHLANAVQASAAADLDRDLNQAILALREAQRAGPAGLKGTAKSGNAVERAASVTRGLFFDTLAQQHLCISGYFQSFSVGPGGNNIQAVDQAGHYYNNSISNICPDSPPATPQPPVPWPGASAIAQPGAQGRNLVVFSTRKGRITVTENGARSAKDIDFHEPIVALDVSPGGEFLGASSALWSVSVWRLGPEGARRVLRWPGSLWNPASWMKLRSIVKSNTNQLTHVLAIHLDKQASGEGQVGIMAAGQDDGRIKIVPVNGAPHHRTKPLTILASGDESAIVALRFSPDGRLLAAGSLDGAVRLWDMSPESPVWKNGSSANAHIVISRWQDDDKSSKDDGGAPWDSWCKGSVASLEFVENQEHMLAVGCQNATTHLYNIERARFGAAYAQRFEQVEMFRGSPEGASILLFDPTTKLLYATGSSPYVDIWHIPTADEFWQRRQLRKKLADLEVKAKTAKTQDELTRPIDAVIDGLCAMSRKNLPACRSQEPGSGGEPVALRIPDAR
jgi:WD40 repeat protein